MHGNSIIPTDAEHDRHYAHTCVRCDAEFGKGNRPAVETKDGDICWECAEKMARWEAEDKE
jgi:hypothetical protein